MLICLQSSQGFYADNIPAGQALGGIVCDEENQLLPTGFHRMEMRLDHLLNYCDINYLNILRSQVTRLYRRHIWLPIANMGSNPTPGAWL